MPCWAFARRLTEQPAQFLDDGRYETRASLGLPGAGGKARITNGGIAEC